jgi:hypothetical protein
VDQCLFTAHCNQELRQLFPDATPSIRLSTSPVPKVAKQTKRLGAAPLLASRFISSS